MAFSLPNAPYKSEWAQPMPDLGEALNKGIKRGFEPREQAQELVKTMLANKIQGAKAKYAQQMEEANLNHILASTTGLNDTHGMAGLNRQILAQKVNEGKLKADLYNQFFNQNTNNPLDNNANQPEQDYQTGSQIPSYNQNLQIASTGREVKNNAPLDYKQALARKILGFPAEMPQEKMEREISTSNIKEQGKLDVKRAQQLRETAKDLELAGLDINGIHDILTGPDSLGTGITKTLLGKLGLGSQKLGEFNERALRLQAQMTKALSSRGGVGAANIVASGKPSSWKSTSENLGLTSAYADRIKNEFELLNQEYKGITGKDLPYTLPEYVHNIGNKMNNNSFKPKTVFNSENEYHDYMKSLKPEQQKMVIKAIRESSR